MADAATRDSTLDSMETKTGVVIAIFAAILAINGLGAGKFGDDEQNAIIEKSNQYSWYQSKSIKKGLAEGQVETLQTLMAAGVIPADRREPVESLIQKLDGKVTRYERESQVILQGASRLADEPWFHEVDPAMREVVGANELHNQVLALGRAGDLFDLGDLFLQLCVVAGAICLVVKRPAFKQQFFAAMLLLGAAGTVFAALAYRAALAV